MIDRNQNYHTISIFSLSLSIYLSIYLSNEQNKNLKELVYCICIIRVYFSHATGVLPQEHPPRLSQQPARPHGLLQPEGHHR